MIFEHDPKVRMGYLIEVNGKLAVEEVSVIE